MARTRTELRDALRRGEITRDQAVAERREARKLATQQKAASSNTSRIRFDLPGFESDPPPTQLSPVGDTPPTQLSPISKRGSDENITFGRTLQNAQRRTTSIATTQTPFVGDEQVAAAEVVAPGDGFQDIISQIKLRELQRLDQASPYQQAEQQYAGRMSLAAQQAFADQAALSKAQEEEERALAELRSQPFQSFRDTEEGRRLLRAQADQERDFGFQQALAGTVRGSRAGEKRQILADIQASQQEALQAQINARRRLQIEQAEGASRARLKELTDRLNLSTEQVIKLEGQFMDTFAELQRDEAERSADLDQFLLEQQFEMQKEAIKENRLAQQAAQDTLFKQLEFGGADFVKSLDPLTKQQLEMNAGFSEGFLNVAASAIEQQNAMGAPVQRSEILEDDAGNATLVMVKEDGTVATQNLGKKARSNFGFSLIKDEFGTPQGVLNTTLGTVTPYTSKDLGPGSSLVADYQQIFKGSSANSFGVDLAGSTGSPIRSSTQGVVVFAGPNGGWGNQVRIMDENGQIHQYSHLNDISVQPGQSVGSGAFLGGMGNTGNVLKADGSPVNDAERAAGRGTHLDYTVYRPGIPQSDFTSAVDLNSRHRDKVYSVDEAMNFAGIKTEADAAQQLVESIMSPGSGISYDSLTAKRKEQIAPLLAQARAQARSSGDTLGMMLASAGGRQADQGFRNSFEKAALVIDQLGSLDNIINNMTGVDSEGNPVTDGGLFGFFGSGPIVGRLRGYDPTDVQAQEAFAQLTAVVPNLARGIFGEVGVLTNQDVELYKKTLPNLNQEADVQKAILALTLRTVKRSIDNKIEVNAGTGVDMSGLVPIYERITRKIQELEAGMVDPNDPAVKNLESPIANSVQTHSFERNASNALDEDVALLRGYESTGSGFTSQEQFQISEIYN